MTERWEPVDWDALGVLFEDYVKRFKKTKYATYEAALFLGDEQVTDWVAGPPCEFGTMERGSADKYKIRLASGQEFDCGHLAALPTGGTFTIDGELTVTAPRPRERT